MKKAILRYIDQHVLPYHQADESRKVILDSLVSQIRTARGNSATSSLIFICTHNSRRSHLSQVWAQIAAYHYGLDIQCYSGGTEETAVYAETLKCMNRAGCEVISLTTGKNPFHALKYADDRPPMLLFSKRFDHPYNPDQNFGAIMTCSDAEENCPFVANAIFRVPVTYKDPKYADDLPDRSEVYDRTCKKIAQEMFYLIKQLV